jgi:F0F1-type ATP synthase membrane subunit b/b'
MSFFTEKRNVDITSIISISAAAVILTLFASWLYYGSKIEKMQSSYETRIGMIKSGMETLQAKNRDLQQKLDKVKDVMSETGEEVAE